MRSVLVIDDEHLLLWALVKRLRNAGLQAEGCESAEDGLDKLKSQQFGLVILDLRLPGMDGIECLKLIGERYPRVVVVMITAHGDIESAVQAMRLGAHNYLTKPFEFKEVLAIAESVLGAIEARPQKTPARGGRAPVTAKRPTPGSSPHGYGIDSLLGQSPAMQQLKALALKISNSGASTVLITGESGTGKDHLAKVIHYCSRRAQKPFVHVNVASLAPTLFESELFGHERGAFTGASVRKKGLMEIADGGSLYLDEIGELDLGLQPDLLQVLEDRTYKRVGGVEQLSVDIRFIAATNSALRSKVSEGSFRQDLYYRLRVVPVELPPLRDRGDDAVELANVFVIRFAELFGREIEPLDSNACAKIRSHNWPGNIRELRNVIERACVLGEENVITADMLTFEEPILMNESGSNRFLSDSGMNLDEMERKLIQTALDRSDGNQMKAAELLGLGRDALRYRMKKYDLL